MDLKLLELFPATIPASEARLIANAIKPSELDNIMLEIFDAACNHKTCINYISSEKNSLTGELVRILRELGYEVYKTALGATIKW